MIRLGLRLNCLLVFDDSKLVRRFETFNKFVPNPLSNGQTPVAAG